MRAGAAAGIGLLVVIALAGLAGCGGGDDDGGGSETPRPTLRSSEPEEATLTRLGLEVDQRGCRNPTEVWHSGYGTVGAKECREAFELFEGFEAGDLRPYGPAAVVAFGRSGFSTVGLVLDRDMKYHVVAVNQQLRARPGVQSDRVAEQAVEAIAANDCDALARVAADMGDAGEPCELEPVTAFRSALGTGDPPKPRRLGGEGGMAFYEVETGEDVYWVVMLVGTRGDDFGFANAFRAG